MIPEFTENGVLPAGIHAATLEQFEERFAIFDQSDQRIRVFKKLKALIDEAWKSGIVQRICVAGSFVTDKPEPNDFDCLLVLDSNIVGQKLRPFQYNLVSRRMARRMFGGDVVPVLEGSQQLQEYLDFFQTTRNGERMGIVEIER
jgi:hypothetical protein